MDVQGDKGVVEMGKRERMTKVKRMTWQGRNDLYFRDYSYRV